MTYKDVPKCPTNMFLLYSNATGTPNSVLADGIRPKNVVITPVISAKTEMTITQGAGGFNKDGLEIRPVLSSDKTQVTFELTITACNMTIIDSFGIKVAAAGNEDIELEAAEEYFTLYVMCYGFDRPFLANPFIEYASLDGNHYTQSLMPYSCNALVSVGRGSLNFDGSGFLFYDHDDAEGKNQVYYAGSPIEPGLYGVVISAQTDIGGANSVGVVHNPFPSGIGVDSHIISIYNGIFQEGNFALALPQKLEFEATDSADAPEGYNHDYILYGGEMVSSGSFNSGGGSFRPVFKGENWQYWERKQENQVSSNTKETHEYRILCNANPDNPSGVFGNIWYLYYRYYLDENEADWRLLKTASGIIIDIPAVKDGEETTLRAGISVPPFSGWGDITAYGDAVYYVKGHGFFNEVSFISLDKEFSPFTIFAGADGKVLVKKTIQDDITFFPEAETWQILTADETITDFEPQTIDYSLVPYAPPKEGDVAIGIEYDAVRAVQALNYSNNEVAIYCNGVAGGIWKRYPLQRLLQPEFCQNIMVNMSGKTKQANRFVSKEKEARLHGGETCEVLPEAYIIYHEEQWGESQEIIGSVNSNAVTAEFDISFPLKGVSSDGDKISSLYGMTGKDGLTFNMLPTDRTYVYRDIGITHSSTRYFWEERDEYMKVTRHKDKPGEQTWNVPVILGRLEAVPEEWWVSGTGSTREEIDNYTHSEVSGSGDDGFADCLLRIGQTDTANGRMLTFAPSCVAKIKGNRKYDYTHTQRVTVDGNIESEDITVSQRTLYVNLNGMHAEAYARTALPNTTVGISREPLDDYGPLGKENFTRSFAISKVNAHTCDKFEYDFECTEIGKGQYSITYNKDGNLPPGRPGEKITEVFEVSCYGKKGSCKTHRHMRVDEGGYSADFSYNAGANTCTLTLRRRNRYLTISNIERTSEYRTYEHYTGYPEYPYDTRIVKTSTSSWSQSKSGGFETKYTPTSDGKYKKVHTVYPDLYADQDTPVSEGPDAGTTETIVSVTPQFLLSEFEALYSEASSEFPEDFEVPEGEWTYISTTADYTEFPIMQNSQGCSYSHRYSDSSSRGLDLDISFRINN